VRYCVLLPPNLLLHLLMLARILKKEPQSLFKDLLSQTILFLRFKAYFTASLLQSSVYSKPFLLLFISRIWILDINNCIFPIGCHSKPIVDIKNWFLTSWNSRNTIITSKNLYFWYQELKLSRNKIIIIKKCLFLTSAVELLLVTMFIFDINNSIFTSDNVNFWYHECDFY